MKSLVALLVALVLPVTVQAQTIHQYPYDPTVTAYANPAAWPTISAQCHWRPGNQNLDATRTPQLQSPSLAHTHMDVKSPIYAELNSNITVSFTIMLFHVAGAVSPLEGISGPLLGPTVWDTNPATIVGDPTGLKMWTGHVTIDLSKADHSGSQRFDVPKRGWFTVEFGVHTYFDNGDQTRTTLYVHMYSMIDPSAPEQSFPQNPGSLASTCGPGSARDTPADAIGLWQVVQYNSYVPILAPITTAIPAAKPGLYGYGTINLPFATGQTRFDMDLHNGNAGTAIASDSAPATTGTVLASPFDPAILGTGVHKVAAIQTQDSGAGSSASDGTVTANEQAAALLVVTVVVGAGVPPVDPPPEVWTNWIVQHGNLSDKIRACPDTSGVGCKLLMTQ